MSLGARYKPRVMQMKRAPLSTLLQNNWSILEGQAIPEARAGRQFAGN
jgi:hypothetical protein